MKTIKTLVIAAAAVVATTLSVGASAMTPWQYEHMRHEHRLVRHEDHRINRALEHGRITPHQARVMHAENHGRI